MERAARPAVLDRLVPLLVGATVIGFALGSSSVPAVTRVGHTLRWVLLVVLLACVLPWARRATAAPRPVAAAAGALVGLALLSTAWSVEPRTTFGRAVSLGVLFATAVALAAGAHGRPDRARSVLVAVIAGAAAVGLAGLALLVLAHHRAVQAATYESPARFKGLGQDPNTVALLFAVVLPLGVWWLVRGHQRALAAGTLLLLAGTIVAAGSRGALAAAAAGALAVVVLRTPRRRTAAIGAAVVVALAAAGAGVQSLPKPARAAATAPSPAPTGPAPKPGYLNAEKSYPLSADVGQPLPGGGQPPVKRSFFGSSGRLDAWGGALHEAARRPLVGHGFGTEAAVFVDRYYRFVGGLPENSYLGLALQLGAAGVLALFALVVVLGRRGLAALRTPRRDLAAAALGVLAAGLVAAVVQSYLYSVGNIAAAALWIPAFMLGTLGDA